MKRFVALALILTMIFALAACGGSSKKAAGTYILTGMTVDGQDYSSFLSMLGMEMNLVLNADGTGSMQMADETADLTWDDKALTIDGQGQPYTFNEADGTITIEEDGTSMVFTRK